ncbi:MAG TPA: cytochrome c oxidase subunit III [Bacteroidetes bacterium]|nr:cytochrome c oxidase subunit III [Bacteroidota bacterium]
MSVRHPPSIHSEYDDNFAFHPWNVMLILILTAITFLFLAIAVAFVYNRLEQGVQPVKLPWLFGFNTLLLLAGSYSLKQAKAAYKADDTTGYLHQLTLTILLTLLFLALQMVAWYQLFQQDVFLDPANNGANYLYLLSALHFAHVLAGLPFLFFFRRSAKQEMKDPVTVLVYFSDPEKRLKLRLLSIYWHFLDALWIALVLFLFFNFLIK